MDRYARNILFWGEERQAVLERSTVLVAGVGGLGATVSQLLVRGGVGRLFLIDDGVVDWPDLNRQTLYGEGDVGRKKLPVAIERLACINSSTHLIPLEGRITSSFRAPAEVATVADCLDNFETRFILHRGTPDGCYYVHGGLAGDQGQILTLIKGTSRPLDEIFAGASQPKGSIPVTPDCVMALAALLAQEVFYSLWDAPRHLDRFLIADLAGFSFSFLDV